MDRGKDGHQAARLTVASILAECSPHPRDEIEGVTEESDLMLIHDENLLKVVRT